MSVSLRAILLTAPALCLLLAPPATGESLVPRDEAPVATVRIGSEGLTPDRTRIEEGRTLRIANRTAGMARVEFHLARGTGVSCATPGEVPIEARKFVLGAGDALHCVPPRGRVEYRVQRMVGSRNRISEGEIEVR